MIISKRLVAVNAISTIITKIVTVTILLSVQYLLLHNVSAEEFSIYPLAGTMLFFFPLISSVFASPSARYVTLAYSKNDHAGITEVISTLSPVLFLITLVMLVIGLSLSYFVDLVFVIAPDYVLDAQIIMALLISSSVVTMLLAPFATGIYTLQKSVLNNLILISGELIKTVLLVILFYGFEARVLWFAIAYFVASLFTQTTRVIVSRRLIPEIRFVRNSFNIRRVRELLGFGVASLVIQFSAFLRGSAPIWILNRMGSPVDVTSFHLGQTAYRQSMQVWMPLRENIGAPMIAMEATGQNDRLKRTYFRGGRIALWLIMAVCTPLMVFHNEVINLYAGETYQGAGLVMLFLLARLPLQITNAMLPQLAQAKAKVARLATISLLSEMVAIVAIVLVISGKESASILAALVALVVSVVTEIGFRWPLAMKLIGGTRKDSVTKILIPGLMPSILSGIVLMLIAGNSVIGSWIELLLIFLLGSMVYVVIGSLFLQAEDKRDLRSLFSYVAKRWSANTR